MKKVNGYGWIIQLVLFVIAIVYFLGYRDNEASAEINQGIDAAIQRHKLEDAETIGKDIQIIKSNLKRSMESQGITWIE